jgi:cation:H+ antiporter
MDALFLNFLSLSAVPVLLAVIAALIWVLVKGADLLVDEAVVLSTRLGIPRVLIGMTIVSMGTTLPEASVSVLAAVSGRPEIALGNAVGSIICNSGLILGLITLLCPISLGSSLVRRQGWFQLFTGLLLVISCIPFFTAGDFMKTGGLLPRQMGVVFLVILVFYLYGSLHWIREKSRETEPPEPGGHRAGIPGTLFRIVLGSGLVVCSSHFLIPAVQEAAARLSLSESAVSATLVAFGTSLPELVTAVTAVRKGFGELALGNIIGANILNVLFVAGAAASVTHGGLAAPAQFFTVLFPAMVGTLFVFGLGIHLSGRVFRKPFSIMLLSIYAVVTLGTYLGIAA